MQKWRKVYLIILISIMAIGGLLGFLFAKSGILKSNTNMFDYLMLFLLAVMIFSEIYDFNKMKIGKQKFGIARFDVMTRSRKRLNGVFIMEIILSIVEISIYFFSHELAILLLGLVLLLFAVTYGVHNKMKNGLSDNGIFHWGVFHGWNEVRSYSFENDTLLKVNILQKQLGFKFNNEVKLIINPKEKEDLKLFLDEKVNL